MADIPTPSRATAPQGPNRAEHRRRYAKLAEAAHSHETRRTVLRSWEGPLPPGGELQAYNDALPGSAERILRMAEKALDAQIEVDTILARGDVHSVRRGDWLSTGVASLSLVCALIVAAAGAPWAVVAVFGRSADIRIQHACPRK